ncbi:MAG TPA: SDR family oxidoreductase [Euzebya sp.]|nr:SDR family oxidoreductase [Euzebya sp.]
MQLTGRTALVTGSSSGIGATIATHLAAEGCRVMIHGRQPDGVATQVEQVQAAGGQADAVLGDLGSPAGTDRLLAAVRELGPVDILVANAGPFGEHTFDTATDDDWLRAFEANVLSVVRCVRALLPGMRERGWGRIITISTRGAVTPLPHMVEYSAAKAAVVNLTASLAQDVAGSGITANTISPGVILTPGMKDMFQKRADTEGDARSWEEIERDIAVEYAANPTGRLGRPDDIAAAAVFLASPRAGYVNGSTLRVDGGITGTVNP